jgi:general secretion pathway protein J
MLVAARSRSPQFGRGRHSGFTLIEAVVSLMLLAVMSVMSYQAVEVILGANDRSRGQLEDESQLHRAWQVISRDIMHLRPRAFADGLGGVERAYITDPSEFGLRFSRGGGPMVRSNPTGISRIEYRINSEDQLERLSWPITASALNVEGNRVILVNDVDDVEIEQFSRGNIFSPDWPPINESHHLLSLPRMIRITIILGNGSETSRLLPGLDFDPNPTSGSTGSGTGSTPGGGTGANGN